MNRSSIALLVPLLVVGPSVAGCARSDDSFASEKKMTLTITSDAFDPGKTIPKKFTGEGEDVSPPLSWSGVPEGAKELALVCDDPDAPVSGGWVHWVMYNIPADVTALPEGVARDAQLTKPAGARQGVNSWPSDNVGYRGPMPPPGHGVHHYHFKLYALDTTLDLAPAKATREALQSAMKDHILAWGEVVGTYERKK